jgi:RimJ/RimL family protein N-acetyltransferase
VSPGSRLDTRIDTGRLILRPPGREDFEAWAGMMSDADHVRHIGGAQPRSVVWRGLMSMVGMWASEGFAMFSVIEKSSGRWIGRIGPWSPEGWPGTEVGWSLVRDACGRGYAVEAAAAAMDWAVDTLGWDTIIHTIAPENDASKAVARRLGSRFLHMGRLPEPFHEATVEIWGQTRDEWRARPRAAGKPEDA